MSNSGLAIVEEVAVRLQRGSGRARFEREIKALLKGQMEKEAVGAPSFDALDRWAEFYREWGMPLISLPTDAQKAALQEYGFRPIFMPSVGEDQYPSDFVKLAWGQYLDVKQIERKPLPGRLVAMETIAKPNWDDQDGYVNDRLGKAIGLDRRFGVSYDDLHAENGILARVANLLGLKVGEVRVPYAEEWNFAGNMFNHLRAEYNENLPDLGATNSWEWCKNAYESRDRLVAGGCGDGGLAAVSRCWRDDRSGGFGFRVLAVL